jgi:hypothetical protein
MDMKIGRRGLRLAVLAAACGALAVTVISSCQVRPAADPAPTATTTPSSAPRATARVSVDTSGGYVGSLSAGFVGLSFESGKLDSGAFAPHGDLPQLLKNLGPSVMRFGGNSVDQSYSGISQSGLQGLAGLARAAGWSVLYSENLGHYSATTVTNDVSAVAATLGSSLAAFACGNEPDIYHGNGVRARTYDESEYLTQVNACYDAIRAGDPGAPLEGPDLAGQVSWLDSYAEAEKGTVTWIGKHVYSLDCPQTAPPAQVAARLLSPATNEQDVTAFDAVSAAAQIAHAQARITEAGSDCGGNDGVSDAYPSTLWAVNFILTGAENGISGMDFHGGLTYSCQYFTPLCQTGTDSYGAQPVYYGMLFAHLLGAGKLLPVTLTSASGNGSPAPGSSGKPNLAAFALRTASGGLRILVENMSPDQTATTIATGSTASGATELTLTAPSLLAQSGIRIQGSQIGSDGTLRPGPATPVSCAAGSCQLTIQPYSAAIVTVHS